ncbi:Protein CBG15851 [Caenorhabditis briggsae]|uniref:Protein CBG15851 n=1 Tax=Caenorhabditis briggsae TaxID=6238 RepID=A8XMW2_CAEBR|nr:Protein CBG15851 [Caenorhabditis briggsae]CAP33987.2 Protein CBG15851 [Caenorhabditis briggsae]
MPPAKRRRGNGPAEQPDLKELIETNIFQLLHKRSRQRFTILKSKWEMCPKRFWRKLKRLKVEWTGRTAPRFLGIKRNEDYLLAYLALKKKPNAEKIYVETSQEISISVENRDRISKTVENRFKSGGVLMYRLLTWKDMEQRYVRDGGVHLEIGVKVNKMEGPIRSKFHQFGVSNEKFSNVILNVDGHKFYVLKELLSMHSSYFEKLFTGGFQESEKPEVTLKEVDPQHFQIFLELIHGYSALDDSTVEGILLLNDIYDAKIVRENCIAFFMEGSDMTAAKKLQLASRYQIDGLAKKTISEIKNAEEYRSLVAEGKDDFSPPILKALLDKALTFTIL